METIFSIILFCITLVLYFHIIYYNKLTDEQLILLDYNDFNQQYCNFIDKIERIGKLKRPCLCTNVTKDMNNLYSFILRELNNLTVHIPYNIVKENVNAYVSLKLNELEHNIVNVNDEAFEMDIAQVKKTQGLSLSQLNLLNNFSERINSISDNYLSKQKILYQKNYLYFSNNSLTSYIPFQYYKSSLNIFHVIEGKCNVIIVNYNDVETETIVNNYGSFRFHSKENIFKGQDKILKTHNKESVPLEKGDVLIVPNNWFVGFELKEQCILLREETHTLISCISAIPDYMKYLFLKNTKIIESKISDEGECSIKLTV